MKSNSTTLTDLLHRLRTRRRWLLILRGLAISIAVMAALLLLTGWAAHQYRHNPSALLTLRIGSVLIFLTTIYFALVRPMLNRLGDARLARLIEEHVPDADDRLVTAVEYSEVERTRTISPALIARLNADATSFSSGLDLGRIIRNSRLLTYGAAALISLLIFGAVLKWGPKEIS